MLILLTIVAIAVAVVFFSRAERGRSVAFCVGLLCLALGARSAALLSDSYSDAFVSSLAAQESLIASDADAAQPQDAADAVVDDAVVDDAVADDAVADDAVADDAVADDAVAEVTSDAEMLDADGSVEAGASSVAESSDQVPIDDIVIADDPVIDIVTEVEYLTERPDWVETRPTLQGNVHRLPVDSGLYSREQEADRALLERLNETIAEYIDDHVGKSYAAKLVGFNIERVGDQGNPDFQLVIDGQAFDMTQEVFREQVRVSVGVMHQTHALVTLDQACREKVDHRWSEIVATCRLFQTGLGAGVVLLLLGTMFSYFKLDTATRGYYTGRLQFGAAAAILALIAVSVVLGKWIPWL